MIVKRSSAAKSLLLFTIILLSLSCTLIGDQDATKESPTPAPTSEEVPASDEITIDYTYTTELITVLYPLYGEILDDFLVVEIINPKSDAVRLLVSSEIQGFTNLTTDTVEIPAGGSLEVRQNPLLITETIDRLNSEKPANFHIRVTQLEGGREVTLLDQTHETLVYGRRDFPWAIEGFSDEEVFELTAAMVMPNDPAVETLIRDAAEYHPDGQMIAAYNSENDANGSVWARLEAIWEAEARDYELTYINTWVSFAPGDSQRIRLPAEVLEQHSGNCIELSLLYASAAEALDLETALLRMPGHVFMSVRTDPVNANDYFIETTLIGQSNFEYAVQRGKEKFDEILPKIADHETYYDWITIKDAREKGIMPLPWH
jgi:hypothetical protein